MANSRQQTHTELSRPSEKDIYYMHTNQLLRARKICYTDKHTQAVYESVILIIIEQTKIQDTRTHTNIHLNQCPRKRGREYRIQTLTN